MCMLATYIVWTALEATYEVSTSLTGSGSPGVARGVLAIIFLYNLAFNIGWTPLQVTYVIEILPYHLRAKGLVLYNLFVACDLIHRLLLYYDAVQYRGCLLQRDVSSFNE